ncbi:MAG: hypothetical protein VB934_00295, partial [Polyangiaceae bacterium]
MVDGAEQTPETPESGETAEHTERVETTWWEDLRDNYFTFDRRTLGLTRILLGFFLIFDLFRRTGDWWRMFSNEGVLPTHVNLWRPQSSGWSIFNAFSTRQELWVLWAVGLAIYLCVLVGYKTRIAQVLAAIFVASMNGRVLLIENGGYVVHNLLLLWTALLPLGDRFSVDAMLSSWRRRREGGADDLNDRHEPEEAWRLDPHVTILGLVLLLQLCAIYGYNYRHKTGPAWHNGTAVHYVLWVDRMVNPLVAAVREHLPTWMLIIMTKATIGMEIGMPIALMSPIARVWAKRTAIVFITLLHLGFGSTFVLGPFAWALCVFSVLLLDREDWEVASRTMKREHRAREVFFDPGSEGALWICRVLKRCNHFELLHFVEDPAARGLETVRPGDTSRVHGRAAAIDILSALPIGPLYAVPLRIPGIGQLLATIGGGLAAPSARFFGMKTTATPATEDIVVDAEDEAALPATSTEEPDAEPMDEYYMRDWLHDYFRHRRWRDSRMIVDFVAFFFGTFLYVYGAPMVKWTAKKLEMKVDLNLGLIPWGGGKDVTVWLSRGDGITYLGLVLLLVFGYQFFKPLVLMVLTTPSAPRVKRQRLFVGLREIIIVAFWMGAINQALSELWAYRSLRLPHPTEVRVLAHKMRYLQGWFMFSPNPVMDDGTLLVDAVTVDGRHVDPLSPDALPGEKLRKPDYDLLHARSFGYSQIWSDYYNRMHLPANTSFRKPMKQYIYRLPKRTGNPNDAIVKGEVYWLHDMNPRFGRTKSYGFEAKKLFSFTNPDATV